MTMVHSRSSKDEKVRRAYAFLLKHEQNGKSFRIDELAHATGWQPGTVQAYRNKKWHGIVTKEAGGAYRAFGISKYTADEWVRLMSQNDEVSADPKRPQLASDVEALVRKARESALLALQIYNSPVTVFRTEGFSVLMVIAWTSLFHAIFERREEPYFYLETDGVTPKQVDGDKKAWELRTCIAELWGDKDTPVRRNLEFFIKFRNRVEHRYVPAIDPLVAGECQALLLNFDELLVAEFGDYFALRESLAVPLQTASVRGTAQLEALRLLHARHFDELRQFVEAYRSDLPPAIYRDHRYSFRVYLVPKTGNHVSSSDLAVEFVKYDPTKPEEMAEYEKVVALIKEKQVPVANAALFRPAQVCNEVEARTGRAFKPSHHHVLAWKKHKVRPDGRFDASACKTDTRYCVPNVAHGDFLYTREWIELLVDELSDDARYESLCRFNAVLRGAAELPEPERSTS